MDETKKPNRGDLVEILAMLGVTGVTDADIRTFTAEEDGMEYSVWHVQNGKDQYVLKKAKGLEIDVYRSFFSEKKPYAPEFFGDCEYRGKSIFSPNTAMAKRFHTARAKSS